MDLIAGLLPEGLTPWAAAVLVAASFLTSALTAAFGVGGGMVMLLLMGMLMPVAVLIPIHGAVQLGSNGGRAWHQRAHVRWRVVAPFVAGSVVGAVAGYFVVVQLPDALLKLVLGIFVIAVTWIAIPKAERIGNAALMAGSAALALISMFVGATGALLSALFAQIFAGDRRALVATHGAAMISQHGLKLLVFAAAGFGFGEWLPLIVAMIVSGFMGTVYGTTLLERLPEEKFRRWFRIGITLLALDMLRQGLAAFA